MRWTILLSLSLIVSLCFVSTSLGQAATALRVDIVNGSTAGDGSTWGNGAYKYLQDALTYADTHPLEEPFEIWVAATGTYYPVESAAGDTNHETDRFSLLSNVELLGGFAGGETDRNQRNWVANETILSGNIDQAGGAWDPHNYSYCVVTASGV